MMEELLAHALKMKRIDLYLQFDRLVVEKEIEPLRAWIKRLSLGEPLEYILGLVEFYGCQIQVDPRVLIPRPETEILVDYIVKKVRKEAKILWDLCTGSGAIGISLKKKLPHLLVSLSDLSKDALNVAKENAKQNEVEVEIVEGDLFTPFQGQKADVITINPPYVTTKEYLNLSKSVRDFEPKMALVGGEIGIEVYERLAKELPSHLQSGGQVFMEIGQGQGDAVSSLFSSAEWAFKKVSQDWSGKDRFFFLEKQ